MQFYFVYAGKAGRAETRTIHAWCTWGDDATVRLLYLLHKQRVMQFLGCISQQFYSCANILQKRKRPNQSLLRSFRNNFCKVHNTILKHLRKCLEIELLLISLSLVTISKHVLQILLSLDFAESVSY